MSLFSPKSTIRQLIQEAEEFTVTPDMEMPQDTGVDVGDITTGLASQEPPAPQPGNGAPQIQIGSLPQPQSDVPTTMTKTVSNAEAIRTQLTQLKSVIVTYEKEFQDNDLSPESAKVAVGGLLNVIIYHAKELEKYLSIDGGESPIAPAPVPDAVTPAPVSTPEESPMPPMNAAPAPEPTNGDIV